MSLHVSHSRRGAIATPHYLATEAGAEAFRKGGTAADAALAAAAVLGVVYPHNTGLGGDSVSLVRTPDGTTVCVNATGVSAEEESLDALAQRHGKRLPIRGVDTVTVPGTLRGWETISAQAGRLPWSELFDAAISLAAKGFSVSRSLAGASELAREDLANDAGCAATFLRADGDALREGDWLVQEQLARTLEAIQRNGADEFYRGAVADTLLAGLNRLGSRLSHRDFAGFASEVTEPLVGQHRDLTILTSPPNTQGFLVLRFLLAITELGEEADVLGAQAGWLAELFELGGRIRESMLCDPHFERMDIDQLLRGDAPVDLETVVEATPRGDTVGISAVDSDGFAISHVQSQFFHFGSAVLEPETGILLHNRGTAFSLNPNAGNRFQPRKRPSHTLMPVMVERDGNLAWVNSCMGGKGQAQVHAHLLLREVEGKTAHEVVSEPRFVVGSYEPAEPENLLHIETEIAEVAVESLTHTRLPHVIEPRYIEKFGQANVIGIDTAGEFDAASDPRSDGSALVVELPNTQPAL